jgi:archaetidylinositol phosphate synthase
MFETIKGHTKKLLIPIAKNIVSVNPNTLTITGLIISLLSAVFFARHEALVAGMFLLVSGFFDALDGAVARENNRITKFGGFLDSVTDRFADAAIIIGAIYGGLENILGLQSWFIGTMAIVGSFMVSYTRARAEAAGASASVGMGERAVRILIIVIGAFLDAISWALLLVALLSFITVFQRIAFVRKVLK